MSKNKIDISGQPAGAIFSECGHYRYVLWRMWNSDLPIITFICLNPSTADSYHNDPTIRRCISFCRKWGYGGFFMCNLFALRSTDPTELKRSIQPIEALNDSNDLFIKNCVGTSDKTIFAWGNYGSLYSRSKEITSMFPDAYCFNKTQSGQPKHPLYISGNQPLQKFTL